MQHYRARTEIAADPEEVHRRLRGALLRAGACVDYQGGVSLIVNGFVTTELGCDDIYCRLRPLAAGTTELSVLLVGPSQSAVAGSILEARRRLVGRLFELVALPSAPRSCRETTTPRATQRA